MKLLLHVLFTFSAVHLFQPLAASNTIKGIVINDRNQPVSQAVVYLSEYNMRYDTRADGRFNFSLSLISNDPKKLNAAPRLIHYYNNALIINNPVAQLVHLAMFDLKGRLLSTLNNSILQSGKGIIPLPDMVQNKTVVIQLQAGNNKQSMLISGLSYTNRTSIPATISSNDRVAMIAKNIIKVSHNVYETREVSVPVTTDSMIIRLYRKLNLHSINYVKVGDTLSAGIVKLTIDSLSDKRCPCDVFCAAAGNVLLYLTFTYNNISSRVILRSYGQQDTIVNGYVFSLDSINPCVLESSDLYRFEISVYPENCNELLFIEHFLDIHGTKISGTSCTRTALVSPRYYYDSQTRRLGYSSFSFINNATKAIFGQGSCMHGEAGDGCVSNLYNMDTFPYTSYDPYKIRNVTIENILSDGTAHISYKHTTFDLAPGQSWTFDTTSLKIEVSCQENITEKERITNYGFFRPNKLWGDSLR